MAYGTISTYTLHSIIMNFNCVNADESIWSWAPQSLVFVWFVARGMKFIASIEWNEDHFCCPQITLTCSAPLPLHTIEKLKVHATYADHYVHRISAIAQRKENDWRCLLVQLIESNQSGISNSMRKKKCQNIFNLLIRRKLHYSVSTNKRYSIPYCYSI